MWDIHHLPPQIQWGRGKMQPSTGILLLMCVCVHIIDTNIGYTIPGWWFEPLWKIIYSQLGLLFPIYGKIKNVPSHQSNSNIGYTILFCHTVGHSQWLSTKKVTNSDANVHQSGDSKEHPTLRASEGFTNHEQRFVNVLYMSCFLGDFEHHLKKSLLEMH